MIQDHVKRDAPESESSQSERLEKGRAAFRENLVDGHDDGSGQEGLVGLPEAREEVVDPISRLVLLVKPLPGELSGDVVSCSGADALDGGRVVGGAAGQHDAEHAVACVEACDKVGGKDSKEDDAGVVVDGAEVFGIEELADEVRHGSVLNGQVLRGLCDAVGERGPANMIPVGDVCSLYRVVSPPPISTTRKENKRDRTWPSFMTAAGTLCCLSA